MLSIDRTIQLFEKVLLTIYKKSVVILAWSAEEDLFDENLLESHVDYCLRDDNLISCILITEEVFKKVTGGRSLEDILSEWERSDRDDLVNKMYQQELENA